MGSTLKKRMKQLLVLLLVVVGLYGLGRLYYQLTDGFTLSNITSNHSYDPRWEIRSLSAAEQKLVDSILSQRFSYLGKGCQSYVFLSADGDYVVKFFKYQRFRPQPWLDYLTFLPSFEEYRQRKIEKKRDRLEGVYGSWKIAFEQLQPETGLVYVHLNKTHNLNKNLLITDKMGVEHHLDLDGMEFLIQRKAQMLCPYIRGLMATGDMAGAQHLLSRIIALVLSEYRRGLADNDHALMQNTGVLNGNPIHVDVGQFMRNESIHTPEVYKQELFTKTYKFRIWLRRDYPDLADYFETQLRHVIGTQFSQMEPRFKPHQ